jgi:RIO kinase 1
LNKTRRHDLSDAFDPTFTGGRQEKEWILRSLSHFYVDEWFTDLLYRVKGGKEATVYCCRAHPGTGLDLIAAKVYRPRVFRAMKNDALYKTGRLIQSREGKYPDSRTERALKKRSSYGRRLDAAAWCQYEVEMLDTLFAAGVEVPRVLASSENAILMEFVGDERQGAPVLQSVDLEPAAANALLDRLLDDVRAMLGCYVVHADLSPYNVLLWGDEIRIIDLPQAVDAIRHPRAFELFCRDVDRLVAWFVRRGVPADPMEVATRLWREAYG